MRWQLLLALGLVTVWLPGAENVGAQDTEPRKPAPQTKIETATQSGPSGVAATGEVPRAGVTLYNGINLPAEWPPNIRHLSREPMPVPYLLSLPDVIPIDVGRQLFVDDFLVESTTLKRSFHKARMHPAAPILIPDKPWEMDEKHPRNPPTAMPFSDGVWYDPSDGLFKMWYVAEAFGPTCLATSRDGIRWEKPSLDVVPGTNIVQPLLVPPAGGRDSSSVWLDLEETNPEHRFKRMVTWRSGMRQTIHYSRDGIHWSESLGNVGTTWDRTTFFYNPFRKVWVFSIKGMSYWDEMETCSSDPEILRTGQFGHMHRVHRFRRYREGPDLLATALSWPYTNPDRGKPETLESYHDPRMWVWTDRLDAPRPHTALSHPEETVPEGVTPQLYNLDAVAYESLMLGLFCIWRGVPREYPARDKINEICLGFSRDGFHWDRPLREPVIPVSENPDDWNHSNVQSAGGGCLVVGDKLYFYVSGRMLRDKRTGDGFSSTGLAVMRRDGFASMDGDDAGGVLTTRPLKFQGNHLFVNVDAPSGELRVEALDDEGEVISPYVMGKCVPISEDSTLTRVEWDGVDDLAALRGERVRFGFHLRQGKLYSFWVSEDQTGASRGYVGAGGPGFTSNLDTVGVDAYTAAAAVAKQSENTAAPKVPSYVIHRANRKITIDGRIDEDDWKQAKSLGDFVFGYGLTEGEQSECKILWDNEYLYFSYVFDDAHLLGIHTDRDGRIPEDDSIEVYITPNLKKPTRHFCFYTNVRAALYDQMFDEEGKGIVKKNPDKGATGRKLSWDSQGVKVAVTIDGTLNKHEDTDRSWSTEIAIPFANFAESSARLPPKPNDTWKLNPCRHAYMADGSCEYSQWAPTIPTTGNFWGPKLFGKVIFSGEKVSPNHSDR